MLKANNLKETDVQKKAIQKDVREILGYIDDKIKDAHESGNKHLIPITIPINFNIPNMKNGDAQTKIYYNIISDLKKRGFYVKIELTEDKTILYVSWFSEEERKQLEYEITVLAEHSKK